jgi:hypothetical protein
MMISFSLKRSFSSIQTFKIKNRIELIHRSRNSSQRIAANRIVKFILEFYSLTEIIFNPLFQFVPCGFHHRSYLH